MSVKRRNGKYGVSRRGLFDDYRQAARRAEKPLRGGKRR